MFYASEASSCADQIGQVSLDSKTSHKSVVRDIRGISNYWKGEAFDAFQKKYESIDRDIQDMHDGMANVASALKNLKKAIIKADDERAFEAAKN